MTLDHCDEVGWPAEQTPVQQDERRLMAPPTRMASRKNALDRHARYRARKRLAKALAKA